MLLSSLNQGGGKKINGAKDKLGQLLEFLLRLTLKLIEAHRVQRDAEDYAETNCSRQSDSQPCLKSNRIPKVDWRIVHIINDDPYAQGPKLHIPVKCLN